MSETFDLKILASDKTFYDGKAVSLSVPAFDGSYQILAHHEPVVMAVKEGVIRFRLTTEDGETVRSGINGRGVVNIMPGQVVVLVASIEAPEEIDRARAQAALDRAREQLRQDQSIQEYEQSKASIARAMVRLSETNGLGDMNEKI